MREWKAGGGHWVVVAERRSQGWGSASDYTLLVPRCGRKIINSGSTNYRSQHPQQDGRFADYFVSVAGRLDTLPGVKLPGM